MEIRDKFEDSEEPTQDEQDFKRLEERAERVLKLREIFDYGFKAGLSKAGLFSSSDAAYEEWIWSREK